MKIYGLTEQEIRSALDTANERYEDNLRFNREPDLERVRRDGKHVYNLTLRVHDSHGPGAKLGYSGRHTVACDYYAHYAFMEAIFTTNSEAKIVTAMERYDGIGEFYAKAPSVADRNVGSIMYPVRYGDM